MGITCDVTLFVIVTKLSQRGRRLEESAVHLAYGILKFDILHELIKL
jgi:hypothetical protein